MDNENKEKEEKEVVNQKQEENNLYDFSEKADEAIKKIVNTTDITNKYEEQEIIDNKSIAMLCYIPFGVLFPIIKKLHKKSKYMLFHVNQGMNLFIYEIAIFLFTSLLNTIFSGITYFPRTIPG